MEDLRIEKMTEEHLETLYDLEEESTLYERAILKLENQTLSYEIQEMEKRIKHYSWKPIDDFVKDSKKIAFLAIHNERYIGRITIEENWNGLAMIDCLVVDKNFRKRGVAHTLMGVAIDWAISRNYKGIMLETQDINVPAIRFYEKYGFQIGGYDSLVYTAFDLDESAFFMYYIF